MIQLSDLKNTSTKIKGIQRGVITVSSTQLSANTTITAVDMSKSELRYLGMDSSTNQYYIPCRIYLLNSTTIRVLRADSTSGTYNISWELTEWL